MTTIITVLHILVCLFLMLVVLLQPGSGEGMGSAFGGATTQTVFGGSGSSTFLRKLTAWSAVVFMLTSITLAFFASSTNSDPLQRFSAQERQQIAERKKAAAEAMSQPLPEGKKPNATSSEGAATTDEGTAPAPTSDEATAPTSDEAPAADKADSDKAEAPAADKADSDKAEAPATGTSP
ncbi:MAG TPA: preprotein translocase subunit SecG, partial [Kofleriaceae bacterium]|nr:preprotein translocase subunit SecG [Kofleriaceae bacterium]